MNRERQLVTGVSRGGARLEHEEGFRALARVGIAARAVIYLILTWLAADIAALGRAPSQTSGTGALEEVARQSGGTVLLAVLAGGLASYGLWRVVQAVATRPRAHKGRVDTERVGWLSIAAVYFFLAGQASALIAGDSTGSGSSEPRPLVARVLLWPAGPELIGLVGLALVVGGGSLAVWGVLHRYERQLDLRAMGGHWRNFVIVVGAIGEVTRGLLVAAVGSLLIAAAVEDSPSTAKSVDQALRSLAQHRFGAVVVGLVAAGLLSFAIYSFFESRLRKL